MKLGRHGIIGVLTLGGAGLLAAGLALELPDLISAAAGCGLVAGLLGWLARPLPQAPAAAPRPAINEMAPLLRELAEEMVRLKRDSAETSRGMAEARAGAARMAQAATTAIARLDESAETSAIAARALAHLPGIADSHAQRIELMAARAEQALAMVPEALAVPLPFEAALARLEEIALPDTDALREAVARLDRLPGEIGQAMHGSLAEAHDAAAALLDQAGARIEAARPDPLLAVGLMEATERLEALAGPLDRARETVEAATRQIQAADDALGRIETASSQQLDAGLSRLEAQQSSRQEIETARLETFRAEIGSRLDRAVQQIEASLTAWQPRLDLGAEFQRLAAQLGEATADLPAMGEALQAGLTQLAAVLEPLVAAGNALPPMTESAQRATEALLRAVQAHLAMAARSREAGPPAPEPEPAPPAAEPPPPPEPPRPPRLLENLDETIRGLQSLSTAIAAAAEARQAA